MMVAGFFVALEEDIKEQQADEVIKLIKNIRGIADVKGVQGDTVQDIRAKVAVKEKLFKLIDEL